MRKYNKYDKIKSEIGSIIEEYYAGNSVNKLSIKYEVSNTFITKLFKLNNVQFRSRADENRTRFGYTLNDKCFSTINSEKDSYFLGFILADGCITNGYLHLTIKQSDGYILKELQNHLGMNYGYSESSVNDKRTNKTYHRSSLQVKNKNITENLRNQNIEPNKSTIEKLPNIDWLNDRHFWRGVMDGDGHVKMSATHRSHILLVGSFEIIQGFIEFCDNTVGLKVQRVPKAIQCKNKILYHVQINNTDAKNVVNYLYKNSTVHLYRKYAEMLKIN